MLLHSLLLMAAVAVATVTALHSNEGDNTTLARRSRLFSVFQVIRFPNDGCAGTSAQNGTCYTAAECSAKGGTNGGTCAQGYGVCCLFTVTCGATSSQNCTYFASPAGARSGVCKATICPLTANICQLRLDFNTFIISGPSTLTVTLGKYFGATGATNYASATQCLLDSFSVTNPGGVSPPVICGVNTGQHMYVEASKSCNDLAFQLGTSPATLSGATLTTRQWSIKVTQYSCSSSNLAPSGCTQYFFGNGGIGIVQSYNYNTATGLHLANQQQIICVRQEAGNCRICWAAVNPTTDFSISGTAPGGLTMAAKCCGQLAASLKFGYDCVSIPGAVSAAALVRKASHICGRSVGLVTATAGTVKSVCSVRVPFQLNFYSDNYESSGTATAEVGYATALPPQRGFQLAFKQSNTPC